MVNYQDPVAIARDSAALVHLWHVMDGIFIWEFFTTLSYEWDIIRGHRPYRWTIWVYSTTRLFTLSTVILCLLGLDTTTRINCQVWISFNITTAYGAYASASLLIVFRVIAIWNREKIAIIIALGIWLTEIAFLLNGVVRFRSTWSPELTTCLLISLDSTKLATIAVLATDIGLLLMMLVGLFRMRLTSGSEFGLGRILWQQGLIWLVVVTISGVPPVVFILLNLNEPLNQIFQNPWLMIVTIAATWMYRSLVNFDSRYDSGTRMSNITPVGTWRVASKMRARSHTEPISLNRMEARTEGSVRTEHDQFSTTQISGVSGDQAGFKAQKVTFGGDVEILENNP